MEKRREIVRRRQGGDKLASIARELKLDYETVRKIWKRYERTGELEPAYEKCRHTEIRTSQEAYERAIEMKRGHPSWGAGLIRVELAASLGEEQVPSKRTLQRWFHRGGVSRKGKAQTAQASVSRGKRPHEVWAVDAKEQIPLGDGSAVSWLTITDEASGVIVEADLFPPKPVESG